MAALYFSPASEPCAQSDPSTVRSEHLRIANEQSLIKTFPYHHPPFSLHTNCTNKKAHNVKCNICVPVGFEKTLNRVRVHLQRERGGGICRPSKSTPRPHWRSTHTGRNIRNFDWKPIFLENGRSPASLSGDSLIGPSPAPPPSRIAATIKGAHKMRKRGKFHENEINFHLEAPMQKL